MKRFLIGLHVGMMVVNFAFWVATDSLFNFGVALLCGAVAIYLVRWGR